MRKEIAQLQAAFTKMGAAMAAVRNAADPDDSSEIYKTQLKQLSQVRTAYNEAAMASGNWHVQTVKHLSASEKFTEQVRKQKLGIGDLTRAWSEYRKTGGGALGEAIKEQTALRNSTATQMTSSLFGKNTTDLHVPKNLGPELDNMRVKLGLIAQATAAASTQMVNWGKNTQWAGRQITVGLTMPLGMAAVGAAALALTVDKELTRLAKVYDTTNTTAIGKEAELAQVRESGIAQATSLAKEYGMAMEDTLNIQAQLAATGLSGANLFQSVAEVSRIATLGEMERQQAIDMTISLQTAFKLSTEELTEAFDFMNQVENSTSLAISDIAEAVPRAASAFSALGGTVQEMTVLMVAMKESGIDPAIGANALKSATSALLNPTQPAIEYFRKTFEVDIPDAVRDAEGNIFELMKSLSEATSQEKGFKPEQIQKGINLLFGRYQFDRATALWTNLGDAAAGASNQTGKAMEVMGMSSGDLAARAEEEIARLQESVSFKFTAAVESMKAALVPLGTTVLQVVTPIVDAVTFLIETFNGLNSVNKTLLLVGAGAMMIVGPIMMLIGIFGNMIGSVVKFGASLGALHMKFRATNAEEAAAAIMAKRAGSAFLTEESAAARLTLQIKALTDAMEQNAIASGAMMSSAGRIGDRQVIPGANGPVYGPGSRDASGKDISGHGPDEQDLARYQQLSVIAGDVDDTTAKTQSRWQRMGPLISGVGMAALPIFAALSINAGGAGGALLDAALVLGGISQMVPLDGVAKKAKEIHKSTWDTVFNIRNWKSAASGVGEVMGGIAGSIGGMFGGRGRHAAGGGIKGMLSGLGGISGAFTKIRASALGVFGPVGILAGGLLIAWQMVDAFHALEEQQKVLAGSAEGWATALGYTYIPGKLPGMSEEDAKGANAVATAQKEMEESTKGLSDAMVAAAKSGTVYEAAMSQALSVITSGGTAENARVAFEASLRMSGIGHQRIKQLLLDFDAVDLADPAQIQNALREQITGAMKGMNAESMGITSGGSFWENVTGAVMQNFGGDLSGPARAAGHKAGVALAQGLTSTNNTGQQAAYFEDLKETMNAGFRGAFNEIATTVANDPARKAIFGNMGVKTADDLATAMSTIDAKIKSGEGLSKVEKAFHDEFTNFTGAWDNDMRQFSEQYQEMLDNVVQGMVDSGHISQSAADEILKNVGSVNGLKVQQIGSDAKPNALISVAEATKEYSNAMKMAESHGVKLTEAEKLAALNALRLKAGMDAAKHSSEGFGGAVQAVVRDLEDLAGAEARVEITPEMMTNQLQTTMSGTMNEVYAEADRRMQVSQTNQVNAIRAAGERRAAAFDKRGKREDKYFDGRQKAMDKAHKNENKSFEKNWDNIEKNAENHYDNQIDQIKNSIDAIQESTEVRIDAIRDQIEAEQEADDERQKIFDRERTRIERMAEMFGNNVDFNAALSTGNIDEAAKIFANNQATTQQWSMDDQEQTMEEAAEARRQVMEENIELIENESEARIKALELQEESINREKDARLESLRVQREAETEALRERQAQEKELLDTRRQAANEALSAAKAADSARTQSMIDNANRQHEAERRTLASRLAELKAFVPRNETEMRQHTARIEALYREYGINLQAQGSGWGQFIGTTLRNNVKSAAAGLQNDINWQAMGQVINDRMTAGTGVSATDLQFFIRNGRFPSQGGFTGIFDKILGITQGIRHTGGEIGGPVGYSSKDRTGYPRSAGRFRNEQMTLLENGEYVVNKQSARHNRDLLEAINSSSTSLHTGGVAEAMPLAMIARQHMMGNVIENAVGAWAGSVASGEIAARRGAESYAGGGNYSGTPAGGGSQVQRMFNTVKQAFPQANLNSGQRGTNDMHGQGKAIDLGQVGRPGGMGHPYLAAMNRWIHDNFRNSYELIYDGAGDDRPDLKRGQPLNYNAATQAQHRNHVHWAMQSFHKGGFANLIPQLQAGGFTMSEGLANLHPGEAVLTRPLTDAFTQNVANGGDTGYNVTIDMRGATITSDVDVERAVERAIDRRESRNGRKRVVK